MIVLVSTRFNHDTWKENQANRQKRKIICFYASPREISDRIPWNARIFVIEMNNSIDQIEGIGLIRNKPSYDKYYKMYVNENYNRYIYFGNYYLSRDYLMNYNRNIVDELDRVLFKGKSHSKRGSGLTQISSKRFKDSEYIKTEIINAFLTFYGNQNNNKLEI